MTDGVDRRWGYSMVRAPMAKDAAQPAILARRPDAVTPPSAAVAVPHPRVALTARPERTADLRAPERGPRAAPTFDILTPTVPGVIPMSAWDAAAAGRTRGRAADAAGAPSLGPAPTSRAAGPVNRTASSANGAAREPKVAPQPESTPAVAPPPSVVRTPDNDAAGPLRRIEPDASALPSPPAPGAGSDDYHHDQQPVTERRPGGADDPSLARLARGVQDCARALACVADRLDGFERRLDAVGVSEVGTWSCDHPTQAHPTPPEHTDLQATVRALEGVSADRLRTLDQRLRKLETLPATVSRLQKDTTLLAHLVTTRRADAAAAPALADTAGRSPAYRQLDPAATTESLERVRSLERAVFEMRRSLERTLSEQSRRSMSEHTHAEARITRLEARLAAVESPATR